MNCWVSIRWFTRYLDPRKIERGGRRRRSRLDGRWWRCKVGFSFLFLYPPLVHQKEKHKQRITMILFNSVNDRILRCLRYGITGPPVFRLWQKIRLSSTVISVRRGHPRFPFRQRNRKGPISPTGVRNGTPGKEVRVSCSKVRDEVSSVEEMVRLGGRRENLPGNTSVTRVYPLGTVRGVEF